jgi:hypothetical protein
MGVIDPEDATDEHFINDSVRNKDKGFIGMFLDDPFERSH